MGTFRSPAREAMDRLLALGPQGYDTLLEEGMKHVHPGQASRHGAKKDRVVYRKLDPISNGTYRIALETLENALTRDGAYHREGDLITAKIKPRCDCTICPCTATPIKATRCTNCGRNRHISASERKRRRRHDIRVTDRLALRSRRVPA